MWDQNYFIGEKIIVTEEGLILQFMFTCAVLGDIYSAILGFTQNGFESIEEDDNVTFNTSIVLESDEIDLSLIVPQDIKTKDRKLLEMADGVLFFLDPNQTGNIEKLKSIIKLTKRIRPDYPILIIIESQDLMIHADINHLLSWLWTNSIAGIFVLPKRETSLIKEYIAHLCYTIISGKPLINPEIIWLQIPKLIGEINSEIDKMHWDRAAHLAEQLTYLYHITRSQDVHIYAEKTAILYANAGEYLNAAQMIRKINPIFADQYRRKYVESMIEEGNSLFNEEEYEEAALKFEMAGNWIRIELNDYSLMKEAYKSAIISWIAESEVQNGFLILEKFDHSEMIQILEEMTERIAVLADVLSDKGQYELAKAQLYLCFQRYQKAGLFDSLEVLAKKAVKVLKRIIHTNIERGDVDGAKLALDELNNIWETYNIEEENVDEIVYKIAKLFINRNDFQKVEVLIPKIENAELKQELTKFRVEKEEKIKELARKGELKDLYSKTEILNHYISYEKHIFDQIIKELKASTEQNLTLTEADVTIAQYIEKAIWFEETGQTHYSNETWKELLHIYLNLKKYHDLLQNLPKIPENQRKEFLQENIQVLVENFKRLEKSEKSDINLEFESYIGRFIRIYRNHLLYDESKELARVLIHYYISFAEKESFQIQTEDIKKLIETSTKIDSLRSTYLENEPLDMDPIFIRIVKYFLSNQNYKEARLYAEKIGNAELSHSYCNKIDKLVEEINTKEVVKQKEKQQQEIFIEKLSQLQEKARDQKMNAENYLRMRSGLKRRYFQEAINLFKDDKLYEAAEKYLETAKELASTKKFELAGINLAVVTLFFLMLKNIRALKHELYKFQTDPRVNYEIYKKTFAAQLIEYIIEMMDSNYPDKLKAAIKLFEVLAFFPEERLILETILEENIEYSDLLEKHNKGMAKTTTKIPSNYKIIIDRLESNIQLRNRRATLELKYWGDCQDHFARQEYEDASVAYLEESFNLSTRNYPEFSMLSLIMGFLTQLKFKTQEEVYREYEKFVFQYGKTYENLLQTDELKLMELVIQYWDVDNASDMILSIMNAFLSHLPLFEWESSFLHRLVQKFHTESNLNQSDSGNEQQQSLYDQNSSDDSLLTQQAIVLSQDIAKLSDEFSKLYTKRQQMVRTYYQEILDEIQHESFQNASAKYIKLLKRMARRKDFNSASLMVLLSTLCKIHAKVPLNEIQTQLEEILNGLGLVKKILDDYFGVKLAKFTLDMLNGSNESIKPYLESIFVQLPLLEKEKRLIHL